MALTIEVLTSKFGRIIPNVNHHTVPVGFKVTGAVEGSPTFEKSLDNITWYPFNADNEYEKNLDGFVTQWTLYHGIKNFYIREVGHEGDVASVLNYDVQLDLTTQGFYPLGTSPLIVTNSISAGTNKLITIRTDKVGDTVRLYSTQYIGGSEKFPEYPDLLTPIAIGKSDSNKLVTLTIPEARNNQRLVASAQGEYEFESFACAPITVGGTILKAAQLDITVNFISLTGSGRNVKVSVNNINGINSSYSIAKDNNESWGYAVNQQFELPFGRNTIFVKENNTGAIFSKSVEILGGGSQTTTDIGLRSDFQGGSNPANGWTYGLYQNGSFIQFDNYGVRDGKTAWGKSSFDFPCVGYGDNNYPLASDAILLHPGHTEGGATSYGTGGSQAVARYTFSAGGQFTTSKLRISKPTPSSNIYATGNPSTYIKYIVKHNSTILWEGVLQNQNEYRDLTINRTVQSGDTIEIISDSASDSDGASPDFDHMHVAFEGQLVSQSVASPSAPDAPTLVSGTGGSTTSINQGQSIKIDTGGTSKWIVVYRNGFMQTLLKSKTNGVTFDYEYIGGAAGIYVVKTLENGVLSADPSPSFSVKVAGASALTAPTVLNSGSITIGEFIKVSATATGTLLIFKDGVQIGSQVYNTAGQSVNIAASEAGSYTFKLTNNGEISSLSNSLSVAASITNCATFVNGFTLGTFAGMDYKVFVFNGYTLQGNIDSEGNITLRNANAINNTEIVSNYKGNQDCFSFPKTGLQAVDQSDIGNVTGYTWQISEDGFNTPYLKPFVAADTVDYDLYFRSSCGEEVKIAISEEVSDPNLITEDKYSNDGIRKVDASFNESSTGVDHYYKTVSLVPGTYYVFYKHYGNSGTPVVVKSMVFS